MRRLAALAGTALLLVVAGCGVDPEAVEIDDGVGAGEEAEPGLGSPGPVEGAEQVPGGGPSPAPGSCVDVPESDDGFYTIADAGTVTLAVEEDRVVVGAVQPAAGWQHTVSDVEGDDVAVVLWQDESTFELTAALQDDSSLELELCAD
ncbi:hypothetical protein [Actinotalea sp. K2]|uniref:hypothetical protein n=1 Tax=Actinotalea sp. K2 TaxID=2939438 RepID=UPI002016BC8F|nr:hypothetical protein [Actinotalea sp. K2]MCL3861032.1 hypothetical protein [Actinotalea sp. K2]